MTLSLFVHDLQIDAEIGVRADERGRRQRLMVDIDISAHEPGGDDLGGAVDYRVLAAIAADSVEGGHVALIETVAARIADACIGLPSVLAASVTVRKPGALAPAMAGVRVDRGRP